MSAVRSRAARAARPRQPASRGAGQNPLREPFSDPPPGRSRSWPQGTGVDPPSAIGGKLIAVYPRQVDIRQRTLGLERFGPGERAVDLGEELKDALPVPRGEANAVIAHAQAGLAPLPEA